MDNTQKDSRSTRTGSQGLAVATLGQAVLVLDGLAHALPSVITHAEHTHSRPHPPHNQQVFVIPGTPEHTIPQGYTAVAYSGQNLKPPPAHMGWSALSASILAYMVIERWQDRKARKEHDARTQQNTALESAVQEYEARHGPIEIPQPEQPPRQNSTRSYLAATAALTAQTVHVGAHLVAAGLLATGASELGASEYIVAAAATLPLIGLGMHTYAHRKTRKEHEQERERNSELTARIAAYHTRFPTAPRT